MDLNISERTNNSPFFINNKSIEEHYTQLILIIDRSKVLLFHLGFLTAVYHISTLYQTQDPDPHLSISTATFAI